MRRQVIALAGGNTVALLAALLAYLAYSRLLDPGQFALWSGAMALGKFGNTVLDSGIKTTIIKHREEITPAVRRALFCGSLVAAVLITVLPLLAAVTLHAFSRAGAQSLGFLSAYAAAYVLTYPFLFLPLADLERHGHFGPVATWESVSLAIEYLLPVPCLLLAPSFLGFVAAVWLARWVRVIGLRSAQGGFGSVQGQDMDWRGASGLFHEGWKLQLATAVSMLRDNLHYLLVAPAFGRVWAGYYAWALQLATASSQVFVQTATRVALPALRAQKDDGSQWASTLVQMKWLAMVTLPVVAFLYHFASLADGLFFSRRWDQALILVLALSLRMLPSIATTSLGALILAQQGAGRLAVSNLGWTLCELAGGAAGLWALGVKGLALSWAVMAWVGLVVFARGVAKGNVREVLAVIALRSSLLVSVLGSVGVYLLQDRLTPQGRLLACAALIVLAILSEPDVRALLAGRVPGRAQEG